MFRGNIGIVSDIGPETLPVRKFARRPTWPPQMYPLDVGFVQILGTTGSTSPFSTKVLANERCKTKLPDPYLFVTDLEPSLQQKFSNIAESELVSQPPENSE